MSRGEHGYRASGRKLGLVLDLVPSEKRSEAVFTNVLVGVDCRAGGRDAAALALRLVEPDGLVTLAYVLASADRDDRDEAEKRLLLERERAGAYGAPLALVEAPSPGRGLHEEAERQGADLLVLGSCRRGAIGRAALGDHTRAALDGAPCAIAIAPTGYAQRAKPFASIGVGYDGSPESAAALDAARALAARTNASVRAFRVVSLPAHAYTAVAVVLGEEIDELVNTADAEMKALPGVEGQAEYGLAGEDLAAFGKEVDLLIVGSRNYGPLHRLIVGSTSRYLQRHARGPLLILPRGTRFAAPRKTREAKSRIRVPA
jgi:nucleotide-binding universal stress UspA family protein